MCVESLTVKVNAALANKHNAFPLPETCALVIDFVVAGAPTSAVTLDNLEGNFFTMSYSREERNEASKVTNERVISSS